MPFQCPTCANPTLEITESVELGPGDDDDERSLQLITCPCGLTGAAFYRESRRGSGESWHHEGFLLEAATIAQIREHMARRELPADLLPRPSFAMTLAD
ncbi:MAG: hypothetical protein H0T46_27950 [Deltaproteobacteria bacterium]|nr:hypothetical protein [Deltaproteobacteria bacterium]